METEIKYNPRISDMIQSLEPEQIRDYAARTDLPAMKTALYLLARRDELKETWGNRYPDYRDTCNFLW